MQRTVDVGWQYLNDHVEDVSTSLVEVLRKAGGVATVTEIRDSFAARWQGELDVTVICRWLVSKGVLEEHSDDVFLTPGSPVVCAQPACVLAGDSEELAF